MPATGHLKCIYSSLEEETSESEEEELLEILMVEDLEEEAELKAEGDTLEDSWEERGDLLVEEEVEGTLGEAIEAEEGEEVVTELGDTEQDGSSDGLP